MNEAGDRCTLVSFDKRGHGFFNGSSFRATNDDEDFQSTMDKSIEFLTAIGFLEAPRSKTQ
jgi:acetyl esterase